MLVFVDESGDAGMKLGAGSSDFFIATAVLFEDHDEANACDARIDEIRAEVRLPAGREFHFNSDSRRVRGYFLERVAAFDFFYLAVVVDKAKLRNPAFQEKNALVKYAARLVFEDAKPRLRDAIITVDANGSKDFRNQLKRYLQKRIKDDAGCRLVKNVKTARSRGNNLLQLADMVSGAVWRWFKSKDGSYRALIAARELSVQAWPRA